MSPVSENEHTYIFRGYVSRVRSRPTKQILYGGSFSKSEDIVDIDI